MLGVFAINHSGTDAEYEGHRNWKVKVTARVAKVASRRHDSERLQGSNGKGALIWKWELIVVLSRVIVYNGRGVSKKFHRRRRGSTWNVVEVARRASNSRFLMVAFSNSPCMTRDYQSFVSAGLIPCRLTSVLENTWYVSAILKYLGYLIEYLRNGMSVTCAILHMFYCLRIWSMLNIILIYLITIKILIIPKY